MSSADLRPVVSGAELLQAAASLSPSEFDLFVSLVLELRVGREAPLLSAPEAELFQKINQGLPDGPRRRYEELIARREAQTLTDEEYAELLRLSDELEALEASRITAIVELARLRQVPFAKMMEDLGILASSHGG